MQSCDRKTYLKGTNAVTKYLSTHVIVNTLHGSHDLAPLKKSMIPQTELSMIDNLRAKKARTKILKQKYICKAILYMQRGEAFHSNTSIMHRNENKMKAPESSCLVSESSW